MKKTLLYIALAVASAAGFASCDDDFERPPITRPGDAEQIEANITLLELKEAFYNASASNYATEIGTNADGEHYIVRGRIGQCLQVACYRGRHFRHGILGEYLEALPVL